MDYSPPGSLVHGISQARILEWVAISISKGSSQTRDWTHVSCTAGGFFAIEPPGKGKWKLQSTETLRRKYGRISLWLQGREGFLKQDAKSVTLKDKRINTLKWGTPVTQIREWKGRPPTRRGHPPHREPAKDWCAEHEEVPQILRKRQPNRQIGARHKPGSYRRENRMLNKAR